MSGGGPPPAQPLSPSAGLVAVIAVEMRLAQAQALVAQDGVGTADVEEEIGHGVVVQELAGLQAQCGLAGLVVAYVYVRAGRQAPPWGRLGTEVAAAPLMLSAGYRLLDAGPQFEAPVVIADPRRRFSSSVGWRGAAP